MAVKKGPLTWEDPPRMRHAKATTDHQAVAEQLKANAGAWAVIGVYSTSNAAASTAQQIRAGRLVAYQPAGTFDAKARTVADEFRVYAVYRGESATDQ